MRWRVLLAAVSGFAGLGFLADAANPSRLCADGTCDEEGADLTSPEFYTSNVRVVIRINNVGDRTLYARATHWINQNKRQGPGSAWYVPASWDPSDKDSDGKQWFAEGNWLGLCTCVGRIPYIRAASPPGNFDGTTWSVQTEEDIEQDTGGEGGGGGGGGGGSGGGMTCYTLTTDWYWYYPDTDTYVYDHSDYRSWCENNGEYQT
ncbi:MAG TPA: hypothetical protein VGQ17_07475 [Gemmatimonadales bacterium]|nr:hypothetical protein [Gemmatimonadales bacterium]